MHEDHRAACSNPPPDSQRRSLLATSLAVPPVLLSTTGLGGCQGAAAGDRQLAFANLAAAEAELARLEAAKALASDAAWTWAQTLQHCAQSIEYSMTGFPAPKSALFQRTLGSAAFGVFRWRGRMTHDLAEPIPGAPALAADVDAAAALARLRKAIAGFAAWTQPLQPHFAYGALDKAGYELAHAMHLANHLSHFRVAA